MRAASSRIAALVLAAVLGGAFARAEDAPAPDVVPLDRFFKGAVLAIEGERIRLRYDFSDPEQTKDWPEWVPFPIAKSGDDKVAIAEGRLRVHGSTGAKHRAEWQGDVVVSSTWVPDGTKDIGGYLTSMESGTDYLTYTLAETYFHGWDGKPGGDTGMIKFGSQWATGKGFNGFRYMALRALSPAPSAGTPLPVVFGRRGKAIMNVGALELESAEPGKKMSVVSVGFYAIKSSFSVDDVVIEGRLAKKFVAGNHLGLRTEKPLAAAAPAGDPALAPLLAAYAAGKESPAALVKYVGDVTHLPADRAQAVEALKKGPRRAIPAVVDLLYHSDPGVRAAGIDVVKALTGKDYGFDAKGSDKARAAAIQRLNKDVQEHPELLEGGGV